MLNRQQVTRAVFLYNELDKVKKFFFADKPEIELHMHRVLGSPKITLTEDVMSLAMRATYNNIVQELTELGVNPSL